MSDDQKASQIQELISEVFAAFAGVEREDGITLREAIAIDEWKSRDEQLAARSLDTDRKWQDVSEETILASSAAPAFLDAKGFRYYLPAFIVYGLKNWNSLSTSMLDACQFCLLHEPQKSLRQSEPASIAAKYGFNSEQCRAIAHFLRFQVGPDNESTTCDAPTLQAVAKWEAFVATLA